MRTRGGGKGGERARKEEEGGKEGKKERRSNCNLGRGVDQDKAKVVNRPKKKEPKPTSVKLRTLIKRHGAKSLKKQEKERERKQRQRSVLSSSRETKE